MPTDIRSILRKICESGGLDSLDKKELSILHRIAGLEKPDDAAPGTKTLYEHILPGILRWQQLFELELDWDDYYDPIIKSATGTPVTSDSVLFRLTRPMTRNRLRSSLKEHIHSDDWFTGSYSMLTAGLAGFRDLCPDIVKYLNRDDFRQKAALYSLLMLDYEDLGSVLARYPDKSAHVYEQVQAAYLARSSPSEQEICSLFDDQISHSIVNQYPELMNIACRTSEQEQAWRDAIESDLEAKRSRSLAEIVVARKSLPLFESFLESLVGDLKLQLAIAAVRAHWVEAQPMLMAAVEAEDGYWSNSIAMIAACAAALAPAEPAFVQAGLSTADSRLLGSIWACALTGRHRSKTVAVLGKCRDDVAAALRCTLALTDGVPPDSASVGCPPDMIDILALCCELRGWPEPLVGKENRLCALETDPAILGSFYREHPELLAKRISQRPEFFETKIKTLLVAGLVPDPVVRSALEIRLLNDDDYGLGDPIALALHLQGGPASQYGQFTVDLQMTGDDDTVPLHPDDTWLAALALAKGPDRARVLTARSLPRIESAAQGLMEYLLLLDEYKDDDLEIGAQAERLEFPISGFLQDLNRLSSGATAEQEREQLAYVAALLPNASARVMAAAALGASTSNSSRNFNLLLELAEQKEESIREAALGALVTAHGNRPEVTRLLLPYLNDANEHAATQILEHLEKHWTDQALEHLVVFFQKDSWTFGDWKQVLVAEMLLRRSRQEPSFNIGALVGHDPGVVNKIYDLNEPLSFIIEEEERAAEARRLCSVALGRLHKPEIVKAHAGRKIMHQILGPDHPAAYVGKPVGMQEWYALADHLVVTYVDKESGSILAEVGDEATGMILNALFENGNQILFRAVWS